MVLKPCSAETTKGGDSNNLEEAIESMEAASSVVLKPCSAGKTTIDADSSKKFEEKADPMEVSSGTVNSCPTKRKAEFDPEEEEDEEEEKDGEIEESSYDKEALRREMIEPPQWDVDSFDGLEYYSSPEVELEEPLSDEDVAIEDYNIVKRQLIESKGFYMEPGRKQIYLYKGIHPLSLDRHALEGKTYREYWKEMVDVCLQKLNEEKECNVKYVEMVRGNRCGGPRSKAYITFLAREKPDGPNVEYQAKAMSTLDGKTHPILCRPSPKPSKSKP